MKNTPATLAVVVVACFLTASTLAQSQILPDVQPDEPGVAVDEAQFPDLPGTYPAAQRLTPDTVANLVELPTTRPPAPDVGPNEAGYVEDLLPEFIPPPDWSKTEDGGHVWAVEFTSLGAEALRVRLRGRFGLDGLELRVYDPVGGWTFGPYQGFDIDENDHWWSTIIFGASIGLEFHVPPGIDVPPIMPQIDGIAYHNAPPPEGEPVQLGCNLEDVMCEEEWLSTARGVCVLAVVNVDVVGYCSGGMLNRNPSDGSPFIMTADHCDPMSKATVFIWSHRSNSCDGEVPNPNTRPRNDGAHLMRSASTADWRLLALKHPPAGGGYLNWASGFWDSFADGTGIHHPRGTHQRISWGYNEGMWYGEFCDENGENCHWAHVWGVRWTFGITRSGSSGSLVFDSDRRVRGTLTGGYNCDVDYYGRLEHAYDRFRPFLYAVASPMWVDGNYGGEEMHGTPEEPFPRLVQGVYAVAAGDRVVIRPASYPDRLTIWRPMRLETSGGMVRIGG